MSEIGLTLAVRGVMVSNERPAPGWIPVKGRKKLNEEYLVRVFLNNAEVIFQFFSSKTNHLDQLLKFGLCSVRIPSNVWASDYRTFVNIIKK